jgi:two-component system, chemotaxis family, CheB/CheR fusion protein
MDDRASDLSNPVIVGIGASAGGVKALQALFEGIPSDTNAAFVVIVHLDPEHSSELSNILGACTKMPVAQVGAPTKLLPNHVYVIPPDRRLHITDHEISAAQFDEPRGRRAPIDLFFRSLADQHGDGFAIILTGAGADGAMGVRAVKAAGGIVLVQDPGEAEHASMPRSAIATGVADVVLPVRRLAERLVELLRRADTVPGIEAPAGFDEEVLRQILAHVRARTGHDFSKYKRSTVLRRIARRMQVVGVDDLRRYYDALRDNGEEAQALLGDLLISVTAFFRDTEAFEALATKFIPALFDGKRASDPIRVWVPGCATGEEAYSIAILLLEEAGRHQIWPTLQVFGSDLDARSLAIAREGRYPTAIEADVGEERLRRFFVREGDHYRVRRELRDIVLFAGHNVLKDPPFSRIDLISCRNLLIYLDREMQQQVCSTFHYALNPGSYLFLGSAETAENPPDLFEVMDRKLRIYKSTALADDKPRLLPRLLGSVGARDTGPRAVAQPTPSAMLGEAAMHRAAIERVAPPSIMVDREHRLVHLSDNAGRYLQPSGGPLSGDAVDLVRPEFRFELRSALNRVFDNRQRTLSGPILVRFNGAPHRVYFQVAEAGGDDEAEPRNALILFIEGEAVDPALAQPDGSPTDNEIVSRLRAELQLAHESLRTTREESEAANEELRAANEELQSINEEYRSTSEELETSKEELQSINEELQTVNSELKLKLDAVSRAHSDLQNLMAATDFGTLFLDTGLRIKRFTDPVTAIFPITPSDEGRPIADFAHLLDYDDLIKDARSVLAHLTPVRHEVHSRDDRWYDVRLRPYRTVDDKIDGVVATFVDVTDRLKVEQALRESEQLLRQEKRLVELSRDPIFIWEYDGTIVEWNLGSQELYGFTREEAIGQRKNRLLSTIVPGSSFDELRRQLLEAGLWNGEVRHRAKDGRELTIETRIVLDTSGSRKLALESTRDITERRRWEQEQRLLLSELSHRVKNTLTVVQAIASQTMRSSGGREDFAERFNGRISALARAHSLLVESNWRGTDFGELVRGQLKPYASEESDRLSVEGPPVILAAEQATAFGLVLHELATNAVKHGSLSRPGGTVSVTWTIGPGNPRRVLTVEWKEKGAPAVKAPLANGFGSSLIERGIPGATVDRQFHRDGVVCTITVPLQQAGEDAGAGPR